MWSFVVSTPGQYTFTASATGFVTVNTGLLDVAGGATLTPTLNLVATP